MLRKKIRNLRHAWNGVRITWKEEVSFKLQVVCAGVVVLLGWFFEISTTEWLFVIGMIGFVLAAEVFNTALEEICDKFKADPDPHIAKIKDLAAAAVLVASSTAFVVGVVIFVPRVLQSLS